VSFSTDMAKLVTDQLTRFVTLNRHQLAGQVANLDFWLGEVRHCLEVIDGYNKRFERLRTAQIRYVEVHQTTEWPLGDTEFPEKASPPGRIPDAELREARRALREAAYRFLVRCFNEGFIDEPALRRDCDSLGLGIEASDLKARK
jgi:hypothetical protein